MAIHFEQDGKIFTLETKNSTYQMKVDEYGFLLHLYYGKKVAGDMEYLLTYYDRGFSGNPYEAGNDRTYSMDALPQEFPFQGNGDYRSTAFEVENQKGIYGSSLRYKGYTVRPGKYHLPGLPAVYAGTEEAETLEIVLKDSSSGIQVCLLYGVLEELDIITRSVKIINSGTDKIYLDKVQSACLDFVGGSYDYITFYGRHAMERNYQRSEVSHGMHGIGSRRGTSSHQYNPMMILADRNTTEDFGNCWVMSFVYSGSFQSEIELDQYNQTRMMMGLQEEMFRYPLGPSEEFYAPEVILSYSDQGLNSLSQKLHKCIREHVCRGKYKNQERPVLLNSWEASYFDFTGDSILELADQAKELGIELLVMDDGWFGDRCDDNRALGDWVVNEEKLGRSLGELAEQIRKKGLKFGIWIEPEMISEESRLYKEHPDWALQVPGRDPVRSRNQLVLDFSRKDIREYIFEQICQVLDSCKPEYLKWDMNRSLSDIYTSSGAEQGKVMYDYVLGVYEFLEHMIERYPEMLIEGCSGGGGRFDAGMLYYTPQIWTSDNTDAIDRVRIQYGTSFGYPMSTMGAHVSIVPNHQTGRVTGMTARQITAMTGAFGYELDPQKLNEEEKAEVRKQVKEYHKYSPLIRNGLYYRLTNPFTDELSAWEVVSEDGKQILLSIIMLENHGNMTVPYVRLKGLNEQGIYRNHYDGKTYTGSALMYGGIPVPVKTGDYQAYQMYMTEIPEQQEKRTEI